MRQEDIERLAQFINAEIAETHISWVLLTKKFAYKIKKPLKTSFLDFSTLARRKKFCYKELELNKQLSPGVYLEVEAISKSGDSFLLTPEHRKPVDYAVKMKRLDSSRQMDVMLSKNLVTRNHIQALAKEISTFHKHTKISKKGKMKGEMIREFNDLLNLKDKILKFFGKRIFEKIERSATKSTAFLEGSYSLFEHRLKNGCVRDGHGDLHSGNIFLYPKPILFDRIEFSERFRHLDVLHEVGFLCMDLEAFGKSSFSKSLLAYYIKYSGIDFGEKEQEVLNYYKCYTANVRAKVNLLGLKSKKDAGEIKKYLEIMFKYADLLFWNDEEFV